MKMSKKVLSLFIAITISLGAVALLNACKEKQTKKFNGLLLIIKEKYSNKANQEKIEQVVKQFEETKALTPEQIKKLNNEMNNIKIEQQKTSPQSQFENYKEMVSIIQMSENLNKDKLESLKKIYKKINELEENNRISFNQAIELRNQMDRTLQKEQVKNKEALLHGIRKNLTVKTKLKSFLDFSNMLKQLRKNGEISREHLSDLDYEIMKIRFKKLQTQ